tara:strand:+ start:1787 stop:6793 length:5007 start_codon:yes stop_codon:yes gene_type:complete
MIKPLDQTTLRRLLEIPFADNGRDPEVGYDCWGGVRAALVEIYGADPGSLEGAYESSLDRDSIARVVSGVSAREEWTRLEESDEVRVGDVALMWAGDQHHVGVCVSTDPSPRVLHWLSGVGAAVQRDSDLWRTHALRSWYRWTPPSWVVEPRVEPMGHAAPEIARPEGETLLEMVEAVVGSVSARTASVTLDGREIVREAWGRVRPKQGTRIGLSVAPAGGGGGGSKNTLRIFLSIAVVAAAAFGPLAFGLQAGTTGFAFASGAIALGGTFLVNALVPPPSIDFGDAAAQDFSPSIQGGRNSSRQFRAIPVVLGEHRVVPALAAQPYTESIGDDQYLRQLFVVGYGPLEIDELKIGETSIDDFDDVEYEIRRGFPGEDPVTLYPGTVFEDRFSINLEATTGGTFNVPGAGPAYRLEFPAPLDADDELTLTVDGTVDLTAGNYTTNAAGVLVSPEISAIGTTPGEVGIYGEPYGGALVLGDLLLGIGPYAFFEADAGNGLGNPTPPTELTATVRLGDLFTDEELEELGDYIKLWPMDSAWNDNSGLFEVTVDNASDWVVRTSQTNADELAVELTAIAGIGRLVGSQLLPIELEFEVEYRAVGDTEWIKALSDDSPEETLSLADFFGGPNSSFLSEIPQVVDGYTVSPSEIPPPIYWDSTEDDLGSTLEPPRSLTFVESLGGVGKQYAIEYEADLHLTPSVATDLGLGAPPYSLQFAVDSVMPFELFVDDVKVLSRYTEDGPAGGPGGPDFSAHQTSVLTFDEYRSDIRVRLRVVRLRSDEDAVDFGAIALGWKFSGDPSFSVVPGGGTPISNPRPLNYPGGRDLGYAANFSSPIIRYYRVTDPVVGNVVTFNTSSTSPVRRTLSWRVDPGQYEVRVRRVTPMFNSTTYTETVHWTALRTIRNEYPINRDCLAVIAMRIRATDQLNGVVDELSCRARSIAMDYEEGDDVWIQRTTSNPASLYRHALQSKANARRADFPDARIDLDMLEYWHGVNVDRGLYFNSVLEQRRTLYQTLVAIASVGRASFTMNDGLYSVVVDEEKTTPAQVVTPRNSSGFRGSKVFPKIPHGLRVQFVNAEQGYQQDERIVLDDGYQLDGVDAFGDPGGMLPEATRFETLSLPGVTSADEAWKHGRYHLAGLRLRSERFSVTMDVENLAAQRGDLVLLNHDVPLVGIGAGRIHELEVDGSGDLAKIYVDEEFVFDGVSSYQIRVRRSDGDTEVHPITQIAGRTSVLELTTPIEPPSSGWPEEGDLVVVGTVDSETIEVVLDRVTPGPDLTAELSFVPHAPGVHDADTGTIPDFVSGVTRPPGQATAPNAPTIVSIASDASVLVLEADGSVVPRIALLLVSSSSDAPAAVGYMARFRRRAETGETPVPYATTPISSGGNLSLEPVVVGTTYEISVRAVDAEGRFSAWTETTHTVAGWDAAPDPVGSLSVLELGDGTRRVAWTIDSEASNLYGVLLRYGPSGTEDWDDLVPLVSGVVTQASPLELDDPAAGTWTFGVRVEDLQGNLSETVFVEATLGASPSGDSVAVVNSRTAGWTGTKTACSVVSDGCLEVDDTTDWDVLASGSVSWDDYSRWNRTPESSMSYVEKYDSGSVQTLRVSVFASSEGGTRTTEVRFSDDDVEWTEWASAASVSDVPTSARYVEARSTITGDGTDVLTLCQQAMTIRT